MTIFGIAFLVVFFTVGGVAGTINDIAVIVQYALLLPIAVVLFRLLRPVDPGRAGRSLAVGLVGIVSVIAVQLLLVLGLLPFGVYLPLVTVAFLTALAWFLLNRGIVEDRGIVPEGMLLTVLAGPYVGYPIWAFKLGARLLAR